MCIRKLRLEGLALALLLSISCWSALPALAAAPEAPVTEAASGVTGTTATLKGELNPHTTAKAGFYFSYSSSGVCEGTSTATEPEKVGKSLKVSAPVTGLEALTTYTFCIVATHVEGELTESTLGPPLSFTTLASKPVVVSESTSAVTPFAATLETQSNSEREATSCKFEYGKTTVTETSVACEPANLEEPNEQHASASLTGLLAGTTYHYRVALKNATGETKGAEGTFTTLTLEKPIVSAESVSELTSTGATLHAQVNPNYQETTFSVQYATNPSLAGAVTVAGVGSLPPEFTELPVSVQTGTLQPGTTYYYRVLATNASGTNQEAPIEHFTTLATPTVTTGAAQNVSRTQATVSGTVDPAGAETTYHFAYIDQAGYDAAIAEGAPNPYVLSKGTSPGNAGSTYESQSIGPVGITELTPGMTYHYALIATNSVGTTIGPDETFTTAAPTPPGANTGGAEGVSQLGATILGSVDTRELQTIVQFEFGTSSGSGSLLPATITGGSGSVETISAAFVNDLLPGTTYYYRVVASNRDGTSDGGVQSFTTGTFPSPFATPVAFPLLPVAAQGSTTKPAPTPAKAPTRAQRLAKALKQCQRKPKKSRAGCRAQAEKKYGAPHKKKAKKK